MRTTTALAVTAIALALAAGAQAQEGGISAIKVSPSPAKVGEPVTVVIEAGAGAPSFCGMTVEFGDAEGRDLKVGSGEGAYQFPVSQTKVYKRAGTFTLSAKGKKVTTHLPCMGKAEATIVVAAAAKAAGGKPACPAGYGAQGKMGKAGDFTCKAGKGAQKPEKALQCKDGLEYFQTKTTLGCRKAKK